MRIVPNPGHRGTGRVLLRKLSGGWLALKNQWRTLQPTIKSKWIVRMPEFPARLRKYWRSVFMIRLIVSATNNQGELSETIVLGILGHELFCYRWKRQGMGKRDKSRTWGRKKLKTFAILFIHLDSNMKAFYVTVNTFTKYHSLKEHRVSGTKTLTV